MVKVFEREGIPVVHMCNLTPVSISVGANRIVTTISIPYPLGDPSTSADEQFRLRVCKVQSALRLLVTDIAEQTVFD